MGIMFNSKLHVSVKKKSFSLIRMINETQSFDTTKIALPRLASCAWQVLRTFAACNYSGDLAASLDVRMIL